MKRYFILIASVIIAVSGLYSSSSAEIVNGIACKVGSEIITIHEFEQVYDFEKQQALLYGGEPPTEKEVMSGLINKLLVEREADRKGIVVSEEELDAFVENIKKQNNLSDEEFLRQLEKEKLTVDMIKDRYRSELLKSRLISQLIADRGYRIPDEEVEQFYKDPKNRRLITMPGIVKLWEIFIPVGSELTYQEAVELKNRALEAYERASSGEDFSKLVLEYSMSAETEKTGGYLGSFTREQLLTMIPPDNVDTIFSLDSGDVTPPLRFKDGYRVFRIEERTESKQLTLEESYESIRSYLLKIKGDTLFKEWLIRVKEATTIKYVRNMG